MRQERKIVPRGSFNLGTTQQETWGNLDNLEGNQGYGVCNTAHGHGWVCVLGGIGCNIDHMAIKAMFNRVNREEERIARIELDRFRDSFRNIRELFMG